MLQRACLAAAVVLSALIPVAVSATLSGAAVKKHNDIVIVTKPTTVTVTHSLDEGTRTESVTAHFVPPRNPAKILPTDYCIRETGGGEVCGSLEFVEYVTSVLTRALDKYYKATETVEHLSTDQVKGVIGCSLAIAAAGLTIALGPESTVIAGPVGVEDIEWSVGCAAAGVLGFIHHL